MHQFKALVIFIMAALFCFYDLILWVFPSVMTNEFMTNFSITSAGIGLLAGCLTYSYALMQLPGGMLLDRFGPRKVITISLLTSGFLLFVFSFIKHFGAAVVLRLIMGVGCSMGYIAPMIVALRWLPLSYYAIAVGVVQLFSDAGAIVGQNLLAQLNESFGWQVSLRLVSLVGFALAIFSWLIIRDYPKDFIKSTEIHQKDPWQGLKIVLQNLQTCLPYLF